MDIEMSTMTNTFPRQRRRPKRTMSVNVRRLQEALRALLNEKDREQFVVALNDYHKRRNVFDFVQVLRRIIDTPVKRQLIVMLRKVIPQSDQHDFDEYSESIMYNIQPRSSPNGGPVNSARRRARTMPSRNISPFLNNSLRNVSSFDSPPLQEGEVKVIVLKQYKDSIGWGFAIRGGEEHGIGIYVSMVDEGSVADDCGVQIGDLIMSANQHSFERISHDEAAQVIKSARKLELVVRHVGRVPGSSFAHQTYSWVDPEGRSVSPPPEVDSTGRYELHGRSKSGLMLLKDSDERKVNCVVDEGRSLGLMIRGGTEFGLGVYITGVDAYSVAENAGLKVGDQILDVNGQSFLDISHAEAVRVLKSSRHMMMTVKDVGRLPFARTTFDTTEWVEGHSLPRPQKNAGKSNTLPASYGSLDRTQMKARRPESSFFRGAGSQLMLSSMTSQPLSMIDDQSRQLLNDSERSTMNYYVSEYQQSHVSIDALVLALFELLNTHAKFSLLNEIRGVIMPKDLDRFDSLVLKKEVESMKARRNEQFQQDRLSQHSLESSLSSAYTTSSVRESDDGHVMPVPLKVPEKLPPNVKLIKENMDSLKIAIDQINDDTDGLPDYFNPVDKWQYVSPPPTQITVAQVHSDFHSSGSSSPKDLEEGARSPSDSGVEVNGHYSSHGSRSSHGRSVPKQLSTFTVSPITYSPPKSVSVNGKSPKDKLKMTNGQTRSPNDKSKSPSNVNSQKPQTAKHAQANKYSRHHRDENQVTSQEFSQQERHHQRSGSPSRKQEVSSDNPRMSEQSPLYVDTNYSHRVNANVEPLLVETNEAYASVNVCNSRFSVDSDNGYSLSGRKKRVTISAQGPVTINDQIEAQTTLKRQGSYDSINTESSTGSPTLKHSGDRHNKRYYSDPMHHIPKEQQKSVETKKKSSEKLYQLKSELVRPETIEPEGDVIIVYKHKPTLGIAIEGGANTRQPLPRIINIQPGGSAHESGGLKVGHVILEIDGHSMSGLEHKQAARLIAESFKNKRTAQMEFVVCEDKEISL